MISLLQFEHQRFEGVITHTHTHRITQGKALTGRMQVGLAVSTRGP